MSDRILITGATGFVGGALVAHAIAEWQSDRLLLTARAANAHDGLARVRQNLRRFGVPESRLRQLTAQQILAGDVRQWNDLDDARSHDVSVVINCAARTSFGRDPSIHAVNVDATLAFAARARRWRRLARFIQVGTAMSCGLDTPSPVLEAPLRNARQVRHVVPYTHSKALAEQRMRDELPDLPLIAVRPSIVIGHSQLGCAPSPSIFWVFSVARALGAFMCNYDDRIDVVPVDYCAQALWTLADRPAPKHDLYHLSAGEEHSCTYRQIDGAIAHALGEAAIGDYEPLAPRDVTALMPQFQQRLGPCQPLLMLRAIRMYGQFAAANLVFDNARLKAEGIAPPPRFTDYAGLCAQTTAGLPIARQLEYDLKWDTPVNATTPSRRVA